MPVGLQQISPMGLRATFNAAAQDVTIAFKTFGIDAQNAADAIKNAYNLTIDQAASVLKQAGYAANEVASALQSAFNTTAGVVAQAMEDVGYAAGDVKNAFEELGGDFKSFADNAWNDVENAFNPSNW